MSLPRQFWCNYSGLGVLWRERVEVRCAGAGLVAWVCGDGVDGSACGCTASAAPTTPIPAAKSDVALASTAGEQKACLRVVLLGVQSFLSD